MTTKSINIINPIFRNSKTSKNGPPKLVHSHHELNLNRPQIVASLALDIVMYF